MDLRSRKLIAPVVVSLLITACSEEPGEATGTSTATVITNPNFVVSAIEESLDVLGYDVGAVDGIPGPESFAALTAFQEDSGLEPTGKLDGATTIALAQVSPDTRGFVVEAVQTQLTELGYYSGLIDGVYGPETEAALTDFHRAQGIDETGSISEETLSVLTEVYIQEVLIPTQEASGYEPPAPPEGEPGEDFLRQGDEGQRVEDMQRRLAQLGYRPGASDGRFGANTTSAVLAFQKREGLSRDGIVGPEVLAKLDDPQGDGPKSRSGPRVEVDLDRQVAFIIDDEGSVTTINISSGSGLEYEEPDGDTAVAYTPTGSFAVERVIDGIREAALGSLYRPLYFKEGWAIHGSPNVPAYPASHGCIRTSNYDQDFIFPTIEVDDPVDIYGTSLGEPSEGAPGF